MMWCRRLHKGANARGSSSGNRSPLLSYFWPLLQTSYCRSTIVVRLSLFALLVAGPAAAAISVRSPNAAVVVRVELVGDELGWAVTFRGASALDRAPLGLVFAGSQSPSLSVASVERAVRDAEVTGLIGKASSARDHYRQATVRFAGSTGKPTLELIVRAYDDGAAYRWVVRSPIPFELADECVGFGIPLLAQAWAMPVKGYDSSYEEYYRSGTLAQALPNDSLVALPLLVRRGPVWVGITEAALHDWAGMYVSRREDVAGLRGRLSPRLDDPRVIVRGHAGAHPSPWRVVLLGDTPGRLIESNLIQLLNPPPTRSDWSWVEPGKTVFPWWNDYYWPGARFTPGLNSATYLAYIDFAADNGIEYVTLDGYQGQAWYGGPIGPDGTLQDLTHARPAIDMRALMAHARARGVKIRVWAHWKPLSEQLDRALAAWAAWGVSGVMSDFMNRDDQQMVAFYDELVAKTAAHHMTITYHGAFKPTGNNRTWPNDLGREAVRGTEYDKFPDNPGSTPAHEALLPFTRMLAGPLDVHQGGFDTVAPAHFHNRNTAPQVMGTRARALAQYVVQESPLSMVADTPVNYTGAIGWDFVRAVPTAWDETRVLWGEVGRGIVIARRRGAVWWLGAITDADARTVTVRLPFAARGHLRVASYVDDPGSPQGVRRTASMVTAGGALTIGMVADGGYAARITVAP